MALAAPGELWCSKRACLASSPYSNQVNPPRREYIVFKHELVCRVCGFSMTVGSGSEFPSCPWVVFFAVQLSEGLPPGIWGLLSDCLVLLQLEWRGLGMHLLRCWDGGTRNMLSLGQFCVLGISCCFLEFNRRDTRSEMALGTRASSCCTLICLEISKRILQKITVACYHACLWHVRILLKPELLLSRGMLVTSVLHLGLFSKHSFFPFGKNIRV